MDEFNAFFFLIIQNLKQKIFMGFGGAEGRGERKKLGCLVTIFDQKKEKKRFFRGQRRDALHERSSRRGCWKRSLAVFIKEERRMGGCWVFDGLHGFFG